MDFMQLMTLQLNHVLFSRQMMVLMLLQKSANVYLNLVAAAVKIKVIYTNSGLFTMQHTMTNVWHSFATGKPGSCGLPDLYSHVSSKKHCKIDADCEGRKKCCYRVNGRVCAHPVAEGMILAKLVIHLGN